MLISFCQSCKDVAVHVWAAGQFPSQIPCPTRFPSTLKINNPFPIIVEVAKGPFQEDSRLSRPLGHFHDCWTKGAYQTHMLQSTPLETLRHRTVREQPWPSGPKSKSHRPGTPFPGFCLWGQRLCWPPHRFSPVTETCRHEEFMLFRV